MADVWGALDEVLERPVAVKILKPSLTGDPVVLARFRREARLAARVNHPNVVAVYDTVTKDGCDALVQELVEGRTLRAALDEQPKLGIGETVRIGVAVAAALDAVHRVGIVHRDVKPSNVLLAGDGRVLLTDFGIATRGRQDLTSDDVMMGTAKYLSPEQVEGQPASTRADLYSLGVVLYECLAGRAPFQAESDAATALARLRADPIPLRTLRPGIPSRLATLVRRCLARDPDDRPRSAAVLRDLLMALEPEVVEDEVRARLGVRLPERRRRRRGGDDTPTGTDTPTDDDADVTPSPSGGVPRPATDGADDTDDPNAEDAHPDEHGPDHPDQSERRDPAETSGPVTPGRVPLAFERPRRWPWLVAGGVVTTLVVAIGLSVLGGSPAGDTGQAPPDVVTVAPGAAAPATFTVTTTEAPSTTAPPASAAGPTTPAPVSIVSIGEFDPPPGDGRENPGRLGNLIDGDPATTWSSLCYDEVGLGAKEGVGLVFELSGSAAGHALEVTSSTRRWSASVFVSDARPSAVRAWGPPVSSRRDITTPTVTFPLEDVEGRYVLLWITRLGESPVCKLPYDIRIGEVVLQ